MNISILLIISVDSKVVIVIIEPTTDCWLGIGEISNKISGPIGKY